MTTDRITRLLELLIFAAFVGGVAALFVVGVKAAMGG